jgi:predicted phage tail protein
MDIIAQLKVERDKAAHQVNALDTAIRALSRLNSTGATRGRRTMSAAARAKISASQNARWARTRGQKVVSIVPKHHISAAGLANIRKASKVRWRKWRAAQKALQASYNLA